MEVSSESSGKSDELRGSKDGVIKEAKLLSLMKDTGYPIFQENGQRKYGPCPYWDGLIPSRGCEVFVGKLPRDCYEDELVPILSKAGTIYELRLMMEFSGANRGFCFVTYTSPDDAKKAARELNNFEIRKGKFIGVCQSVDNCRLFIGGLPRDKQRDEIMEEVRHLAEGVVDCIVYSDVRDKTKNRGFAFVEFESHRAAAMARRKLVGSGPVQLWGQQIAIDWAEPEVEIDEDIMSQVKILYFRNLMMDTSEEMIEKLCNQAAKKENAVERVKKLRDYAFVHFRDRNDALSVMKELNGRVVDGAAIEVVLAKPVDKNTATKHSKQEQNQQVVGLPGMTYITAGSLVTSPTSDSHAAAHASRELLGRNPLVMGTRECSKGRVRGAGGIGRVYSQTKSPYKKTPNEGRAFGIYPGVEVVLTSPVVFSPPLAQAKLPAQILDEICISNGWGQPTYTFFSTYKQEGASEVRQYFCEVLIPSFAHVFRPSVMSLSPEEAKDSVAQCTLIELSKMGLIPAGAVGSMVNPTVAPLQPLPAILPSSPSLPSLPTPAPVLTASSIYANPPLVPASPQLLLTKGSFGEIHSDFFPTTSVLSVVTSPTYFVSAGKVPMGNSFPVLSSIPYTAVPVSGYRI